MKEQMNEDNFNFEDSKQEEDTFTQESPRKSKDQIDSKHPSDKIENESDVDGD